MGLRTFNIKDILQSVVGYKGLPFPGAYFPEYPGKYQGDDMSLNMDYYQPKTYSDLGSILRKKDAHGRWYFMPVILNGIEIPHAVISVIGKKTIIETPMVGRKGTVKELISLDDYEINIAGVCLDSDWPEEQIQQLRDLFNINESIPLECALTDIFLEEEDLVVIKNIDFPAMKGFETVQVFTMNLVTDRSFELIIE